MPVTHAQDHSRKPNDHREMARQLVVSEGTVKTHISDLFAKLGVTDRAGAMALAYGSGLGRIP